MDWISVTDRLPEATQPIEHSNISDDVLIGNDVYCSVGYYSYADEEWVCDHEEMTPTHWMPLPALPT